MFIFYKTWPSSSKANDSLRVIYRVNSYILQLKGLLRDQCGLYYSKVSNSKSLFRDVKKGIMHLFSARERVRLLNVLKKSFKKSPLKKKKKLKQKELMKYFSKDFKQLN